VGCYALSTGRHLPVHKRRNTPAKCNQNSLSLVILTRISVFQYVTGLRLVSSTVFYRDHEPQTLKQRHCSHPVIQRHIRFWYRIIVISSSRSSGLRRVTAEKAGVCYIGVGEEGGEPLHFNSIYLS